LYKVNIYQILFPAITSDIRRSIPRDISHHQDGVALFNHVENELYAACSQTRELMMEKLNMPWSKDGINNPTTQLDCIIKSVEDDIKLIENINKLVKLKDGEGVHKFLDVDEEIKRTILPKIESQVSAWSMDVKVFKMEYKKDGISFENLRHFVKTKRLEVERDQLKRSRMEGSNFCGDMVNIAMDAELAKYITNNQEELSMYVNKKKCYKCGEEGHVAKDCSSMVVTKKEMEEYMRLKQKFGHTLRQDPRGKGKGDTGKRAYVFEDYTAGDVWCDEDNYHMASSTKELTWEEICAMKEDEYNIDTSGSEG
jgi:hypothetical protein